MSWENITENTYTFSISPNDKLQNTNLGPKRIKIIGDHIRNLLHHYLNGYIWTLHTEISYPTQTQEGRSGRIHYHGIIELDGYKKPELYAERIHHINKQCRIEIDTITDIKIWKEYCTKDETTMSLYGKAKKYPHILAHDLPLPSSWETYLKLKRSQKSF